MTGTDLGTFPEGVRLILRLRNATAYIQRTPELTVKVIMSSRDLCPKNVSDTLDAVACCVFIAAIRTAIEMCFQESPTNFKVHRKNDSESVMSFTLSFPSNTSGAHIVAAIEMAVKGMYQLAHRVLNNAADLAEKGMKPKV